MSDISIPGVNSKYGTQKIIEQLMAVEKTKLTKMENAKKTYQEDKAVWQSLNKRMQSVREASRNLFGFNTPFFNKIGSSSDEKALTVQASRTASNGSYSIKVINVAGNDQFLSNSLALDTNVPAGEYKFKVGDKDVTVNFKGGKLTNFVEAINLKNPDLLKASLIKDTSTTQVFQIEAIPVGEKNKLQFSGVSLETMKQLGVIGPADTLKKPFQEPAVTIPPGDKKEWKLEAPLALPKAAVLELTVSTQKLDPASLQTPKETFTPPEGGSVTFQDIQLLNNPMKTELPIPEAPPPVVDVTNMKALSATGAGKTVDLNELPDSATPVSVSIPIGESTPSIDSLVLTNRNTLKQITVSNVQIVDPTTRGDFKPLHPINQAKDAVIDFDGIRIVRDSNAVKDVVSGVTLNLLGPSKEKIEVKVEPDRKAIKDGVINLLGTYNRLLTDILVLTSYPGGDATSSSVIQEATYLTDAEKKEAEKNLGKFQGDVSLNQLKSSLQRAMMSAYSSEGSNFSLLSQVGISTNVSGGAGDRVNASKLRGYLEMDESVFDSSITQDLDGVRKLFGNSTDGTLVVNSGAAFVVDQNLRPFTELGGLNASRTATIDVQIKAKDKEMADYKDHLVRYEQELKRKYGQMESALNSMQKNSEQLNNMNNQNR